MQRFVKPDDIIDNTVRIISTNWTRARLPLCCRDAETALENLSRTDCGRSSSALSATVIDYIRLRKYINNNYTINANPN